MLTTDQSMKLLSAGVLLGRAGELLSEFEAGLVAEVCRRFTEFTADTVVTDAEWQVIDEAIEAMRPVVSARVRAAEADQAA